MQITKELLFAVAPSARQEIATSIVANAALPAKYGITDPTELAYFLGQTACETNAFNTLEECLYYTLEARIRQVYPGRFKTDAEATPYVRQPQKLANFVYGGRYGNTRPTDGYDFRGSGVIMTTFLNNFKDVRAATGVDCVNKPDLLRQLPSAFEAACIYWSTRGLGKFAKAGDIVGLTKAIQGGSGGLADRRVYTDRALRAVASKTLPSVTDISHWLRYGSKSDAVTALQTLLISKGYAGVGKVDGDFGEATEDAVKHFQTDHGLMADGVVGEKTAAALAAAPADTNPYSKPIEPGKPIPSPAPPKSPAVPLSLGAGAILAAWGSRFLHGEAPSWQYIVGGVLALALVVAVVSLIYLILRGRK